MEVSLNNIQVKTTLAPIKIDKSIVLKEAKFDYEDEFEPLPGDSIGITDLHRLNIEERIQVNWEKFENMGLISHEGERLGNYEGINNAWCGKTCYVVGGSIAGRGFDLTKLEGKKSIGVNHMIEYWDGFSWFIFQDHCFLRKTIYNLHNFKGKIFAHNSAPIRKADYDNLTYFKSCSYGRPMSEKIQYGLFSRSLTGICATHLAIISGAKTIYLIGLDCPMDVNIDEGFHYQKGYASERGGVKGFEGIKKAMNLFKKFLPWKNKIINCYKGGVLESYGFKSIDIKDMPL